MSRDPRDWGTAAIVTLIVLASIATGIALGTFLAWDGLTDDTRSTARTLICAAAIVAIAADLLYMAPLARRLVRAYWQDWRDRRSRTGRAVGRVLVEIRVESDKHCPCEDCTEILGICQDATSWQVAP